MTVPSDIQLLIDLFARNEFQNELDKIISELNPEDPQKVKPELITKFMEDKTVEREYKRVLLNNLLSNNQYLSYYVCFIYMKYYNVTFNQTGLLSISPILHDVSKKHGLTLTADLTQGTNKKNTINVKVTLCGSDTDCFSCRMITRLGFSKVPPFSISLLKGGNELNIMTPGLSKSLRIDILDNFLCLLFLSKKERDTFERPDALMIMAMARQMWCLQYFFKEYKEDLPNLDEDSTASQVQSVPQLIPSVY